MSDDPINREEHPAASVRGPCESVLVAGHVNLDRIWQLASPLRAGGRLSVVSRRLRLGGGGANTAVALAALGTPVALTCRLGTDLAGDAMLSWLAEAGIDTSQVERHDGATQPGDILLDPAGERTLLGVASAARFSIPSALYAGTGIAYVNLSRLADPSLLAPIAACRMVVAQMPLDLARPCPSQLLIASRSDLHGIPPAELFRIRAAINPELRHVVITDGPGCVIVADARAEQVLERLAPIVTADTIGAGDFFAAGLLQALARGKAVMEAAIAGQQAARHLLVSRPAVLAEWRDVRMMNLPGTR